MVRKQLGELGKVNEEGEKNCKEENAARYELLTDSCIHNTKPNQADKPYAATITMLDVLILSVL